MEQAQEGLLWHETPTSAGTPVTQREWRVTIGGREISWRGFHTGPSVLTEANIVQLAFILLDQDIPKVHAEAEQKLVPNVASAGQAEKALIMHGATTTTKGFEGDLTDVIAGRGAFDVAAYLETRAVYLAKPGDVAVGRTDPWREAVIRSAVDAVDVGEIETYYTSHALLELAVRHLQQPQPPLLRLIDLAVENPGIVIRMYALDTEMQIFLLWLMRQAGLERLAVDANSAAIANQWNNKSHLHPEVNLAAAIDVDGLEVTQILAAEQQKSRLARELMVRIPVLPGYTIRRHMVDTEMFVAQLVLAATLLKDRYGLAFACLKPTEAGDGARIEGNLPVHDEQALRRVGQEAYVHGDDYILEAQLDYRMFDLPDGPCIVAPSAHIRFGHIAPGCTIQIIRDRAWFGNIYTDAASCGEFGLEEAEYNRILAAMVELTAGFIKLAGEDGHSPLVMGGIDFGVGTIGGKFGERSVLAVQDPNLSSHGAEYLRTFLDRMRVRHSLAAADAIYGSTYVIRPLNEVGYNEIEPVMRQVAPAAIQCELVACVPGRWGMIAASGTSPLAAVGQVYELAAHLRKEGLIA